VNEDDCKTLFEEKYDETMSDEQMRRAFAFYNELGYRYAVTELARNELT